MKNIKFLLIAAFVGFAFLQSCDDDGASNSLSGASFERTISSFSEGDGSGTVEITVDGYSGSEEGIEFAYTGTALAGADYEVVGFSDGVLTINVLEDDSLELTETINIRIVSADGGVGRTRTHTLSIYSNCDDLAGLAASHFSGVWSALEDYTATDNGTFGPYNVTFVQDGSNPNRFNFTNFYGTASRAAYVIFDLASGTVSFPNQTPTNPGSAGAISASSGTFDLCENTLTIDLNYDGLTWTYRFSR